MKTRLIIAILSLLVLAVSPSALSETMRAADEEGEVLLYDSPCMNKMILEIVRKHIKYGLSFRGGRYNTKAVSYPMCWTLLPDATIGLAYEDGDMGRMFLFEFSPAP